MPVMRGRGDDDMTCSNPTRQAQATWIVQIACMRHTMTATASAATPMITVLHRLRSSSAHATAAGGRSAAETR